MTNPRRTGLRRLWYVASWRCRYWYLDTREGLVARIVLALGLLVAAVWSAWASLQQMQRPPVAGEPIKAIADWIVYAIVFVVSLLVAYALAPKPQSAKPQKIEVARVEDGATLKRIYGPVWITDPVVIGDKPMGTVAIRKKAGKSLTLKTKWQTVGYWYKRIFHFMLCRGPIDSVLAIRAGDKEVWSGELGESSNLFISRLNLWGGEDSEGGIEGVFEFKFGDADQEPSAYLAANLAPEQSAYRGRASVVFQGGRWGNSPYFKSPAFLVSRILEGWDNDECWYPGKAEVPLYGGFVTMLGDGWEYVIQTFSEPNSGWNDFTVPTTGWQQGGELPYTTSDTWAPMRSNIWLRRRMQVNAVGLTLNIGADNGCVVWVDGEEVGTSNPTNANIASNQNNPVSFEFGATGTVEVVVKAFAEVSAGNDSGNVIQLSFTGTPLVGMNAAHVLYDSLAALEMDGEPVALIHDASWRAAADRLYAEGFGIGTEYDASSETIEQFQQRLCDLIGAQLSRDPTTGLWHLDLVRDDIGIDDLPVLTDDDILEFERQPAVLDEAVNQVVVEWFDPLKKENRSTAPLQALGAIQAFGAVNGEVRTFREILNEDLALRVGARDLRARSTPLERLSATTTRVPYSWRKGRKFRVQAPKKGIADMVCVLGEIDRGTLRSGAMRITAVQDVASMPDTTYVTGEPGIDTGTSGQAYPPPAQLAFELPYRELVQVTSEAEMAFMSPGAGYVAVVAADPGGAIDYQLWTRVGADDFAEAGDGVWCPTATVVEASAADDPDGGLLRTGFTLANGKGLSDVAVGSAARWGTEEVRVDVIDPVTGAVEFGRGCADTVPAPHAAGERVWFYDQDAAVDPTEYQAGESVQAKALTRTGSDQLQMEAATAMTVVMASRAARPYPPQRPTVNGSASPGTVTGSFDVAWVPRNRLTQGVALVDALQPAVAAEAGTTYTLRARIGGVVVDEVTGLTGDSASGITLGDSGTVTLEYVAVRDGLESWQAPTVEFYYGGVLLLGDFTDWTTGNPYDGYQLPITGGLPPYTVTLATGSSLPSGWSLSSSGVLTGPAVASATSFSFDVDVEDSIGDSGTTSQTITIAANANFASALALCNFESAADGATTYTDGTGRVWNAVGTGPHIEEDDKRHGAKALYLPGTSGTYFQSTDALLNRLDNDFTIKMWAKWLGGGSGVRGFFFAGNLGSNNGRLMIQQSSDHSPALWLEPGSTSTAIGGPLAVGEWTHLCVTRQGSAIRCFRDGVLTNTGSNGNDLNMIAGATMNLGIARSSSTTSNRSFNGYVDDVEVYDTCLHTASFDPGPPPAMTAS